MMDRDFAKTRKNKLAKVQSVQTRAWSYHHIIISSYHHIIISSYHHIIISSYHHIIIASNHHVIMSSCHHVIMSSCHHVIMSSCHHIIISSYHHIIISSYHHYFRYSQTACGQCARRSSGMKDQAKLRLSTKKIRSSEVPISDAKKNWRSKYPGLTRLMVSKSHGSHVAYMSFFFARETAVCALCTSQ